MYRYRDSARLEEVLRSLEERDLADGIGLWHDALDEHERMAKPRQIGIARWSIARTLRELGRVDEALAIQQQLAAENAATGVDDPFVAEEIQACEAVLDAAGKKGSSTRA